MSLHSNQRCPSCGRPRRKREREAGRASSDRDAVIDDALNKVLRHARLMHDENQCEVIIIPVSIFTELKDSVHKRKG